MDERYASGSVAVFLLFIFLGITLQGATFKKYEVFSGKITYKIYYKKTEGNGAIREINGTKRLIFDQHGFREFQEERSRLHTILMGAEQKHEIHTMTLRDGNDLKMVDFKQKKIKQIQLPYSALLVRVAQSNMTREAEEMLRRSGGRKVRKKVIAGYECDLWEFPGTDICIYRGIPLEIERKIGGIVRHEEAVRAELNVPVSSDEYALPEFPVVKVSAREAPITEILEGISSLPRFQPIKSEKPAMMIDDQAYYNAIRRRSLQRIASIKKLYECLEKSKDLKESNRCGESYAHEIGGVYAAGELWNEAVREIVLQSLGRALKVGECIQKAENLEQLVECENPSTKGTQKGKD